ncbi:MAG: histone deacetylase [Candidatus Aenigmatarchaeota archaeon]
MVKIFYSPKCLDYWQEGHFESPARVKNTYELLKDEFTISEAMPCKKKDMILVHSKRFVNSVASGNFFDKESPNLPKIYEIASLSAGGAVAAMKHTMKDNENTFSLMRPPGHHAGKNFLGGFCYFNNIAIAVRKAMMKLDRIAILDIDGHHGNGTQDIFFGTEGVLYVSLHQKNAFPMSGFISENNCFNYPLLPGTKPDKYLETLEDAIEKIDEFNPDLIAVSAGFDTYKNDPLLNIELNVKTYREIASLVAGLKKPTFAVLEGGYHEDLPKCILEFLRGIE